MSDFGDFTPDDAWDPGQADPYAIAVRIHDEVRNITGDVARPRFEQLGQLEQWVWIVAVARVLDVLRREGTR